MGAKVIAVVQPKGGTGKSTISAHLAVALEQRGGAVALIDCDPQGSLTRWHSLREQWLGKGYTGVYFAAISGWRLRSEIERMKGRFSVIVIDGPAHNDIDTRNALRCADIALIPMQPGPTDLWAMEHITGMADVKRVPYATVFNRVNHQSKLARAMEKAVPGLTGARLGNRVAFAVSMLHGQTAMEM
ncbi:MAG: ParA family protein, partial [Rickettsiales bacterium]|nr:ParA family protein [Rickettsiales bacterium]